MSLTDEKAGRMLPAEINTEENRRALIAAGKNASGVGRALAGMHGADPALITQDNLDVLIAAGENALGVGAALAEMHRTDPALITQGNFDALIAAGGNAQGVAYALAEMHREDPALITPENRQALIAAGKNAQGVGRALADMHRAAPALITPENRRALIDAGANTQDVGAALALMHEANPALITPENCQALIAAAVNRWNVSGALKMLGEIDIAIANQESFNVLITAGENTFMMGYVLAALGRATPKLLTPENCRALIASDVYVHGLRYLLDTMYEADPMLITQDNFNALIAAGANAMAVGYALVDMYRANPALITPGNRQALIAAGPNAEGLYRALQELGGTDRALVNQDNFDALIRQGANALNHAREIIRRAFRPAEAAAVLPIGDRQSTHLASVHKSSSDSATRLMTRYDDSIQGPNLEATLEAIRIWARGLPEDRQAVKNSVARLTAVSFAFEDPGSCVSMHQLLALAWKALHDDGTRTGTLDDGLVQFAQGLEEIQNEYGPDRPACTGGSFNKIIEKLVGIHPDAEQLVITSGQAAKKLNIVVKEEVYKYLESMSSPRTPEALQAFTDLIAKIRAEGIDVIWPNIKDAVETRMIDEFGSIYNNRKDDARFQELLLAGVSCVELDELDRFQKQISESEGYQKWMRAALRDGLLPSEPTIAPGTRDRSKP